MRRKNKEMNNTIKQPKLAIIIPCFNEEKGLSNAIFRLSAVLDGLIKVGKISSESELLFVDDGSKDATWDIIEKSKNDYVKGIKLSANRGHQTALIAGMEFVKDKCDCLISIDSDGQQDENKISEFIDKYLQGADIVFGVRRDRKSDSFFKKFSAEFFYKLMRAMGVSILRNAADFRLLSSRANNAVLEHTEVNLFLRGIAGLVGFKTAIVYFDVKEREFGETKYTLKKMFSFALGAIFSFSIFPIRLVSLLGILTICLCMISSVYALYFVFNGENIPGWASTTLPLYFIGGVQIFSLGIIGEYIGRIYREIKKRPKYFIEKYKNHGEEC
jgi:glycosyltransferase involved in cell wall biosynthesis